MLPSGTSKKSQNHSDAALPAHPDAGPATPGDGSSIHLPPLPPSAASGSGAMPKALKMKKKVKAKFVVTDAQLDKLADILCEMFHQEAAGIPYQQKKQGPRECLTALLA